MQARAEFEVAVLVDPTDVEALTALGQLHLREGRLEDRVAQVSRAEVGLLPEAWVAMRDVSLAVLAAALAVGVVDRGGVVGHARRVLRVAAQ